MLYLKDTQTVPVSKVYALYTRQNTEGKVVTYIIMENILGDSLDAVWASLEAKDKKKIAQVLRVHFDKLRAVPTPGYYGALGHRKFEDSVFWTSPHDDADDNGQIGGPFDTEQELNEALVDKYTYNNGPPEKVKFYTRLLPCVFKNHKAVFTHADLQKKNIMLKKDGSLVVIDWEAAGWYPDYWEYALATVAVGAWKDDFQEYLAQALDDYPKEYAWLNMIIRELWS